MSLPILKLIEYSSINSLITAFESLGSTDRAIISSILSVAANGIYAAANKFSGMYINAYNIFNIAWTESAAVHINDQDKDEYFSKKLGKNFMIKIKVMNWLFDMGLSRLAKKEGR